MQIAQDNATASPALGVARPEGAGGARGPYAEYKVIRRNGAVVGFEPAKIAVAMTKAFLAVNGSQGAASARIRELVAGLTDSAVAALAALLKRLALPQIAAHSDVAPGRKTDPGARFDWPRLLTALATY